MSTCPCRLLDENKVELSQCCGPYLAGGKNALTAEALMRARYSAYATLNMDFLERTHKRDHGESFDRPSALKWAQDSNWKGMTVHSTTNGKESDSKGIVEFSAHYEDKASGKVVEHREKSLFEKIQGAWLFLEGQVVGMEPLRRMLPKVGRNDPCHCGSGKKFKKCCGA